MKIKLSEQLKTYLVQLNEQMLRLSNHISGEDFTSEYSPCVMLCIAYTEFAISEGSITLEDLKNLFANIIQLSNCEDPWLNARDIDPESYKKSLNLCYAQIFIEANLSQNYLRLKEVTKPFLVITDTNMAIDELTTASYGKIYISPTPKTWQSSDAKLTISPITREYRTNLSKAISNHSNCEMLLTDVNLLELLACKTKKDLLDQTLAHGKNSYDDSFGSTSTNSSEKKEYFSENMRYLYELTGGDISFTNELLNQQGGSTENTHLILDYLNKTEDYLRAKLENGDVKNAYEAFKEDRKRCLIRLLPNLRLPKDEDEAKLDSNLWSLGAKEFANLEKRKSEIPHSFKYNGNPFKKEKKRDDDDPFNIFNQFREQFDTTSKKEKARFCCFDFLMLFEAYKLAEKHPGKKVLIYTSNVDMLDQIFGNPLLIYLTKQIHFVIPGLNIKLPQELVSSENNQGATAKVISDELDSLLTCISNTNQTNSSSYEKRELFCLTPTYIATGNAKDLKLTVLTSVLSTLTRHSTTFLLKHISTERIIMKTNDQDIGLAVLDVLLPAQTGFLAFLGSNDAGYENALSDDVVNKFILLAHQKTHNYHNLFLYLQLVVLENMALTDLSTSVEFKGKTIQAWLIKFFEHERFNQTWRDLAKDHDLALDTTITPFQGYLASFKANVITSVDHSTDKATVKSNTRHDALITETLALANTATSNAGVIEKIQCCFSNYNNTALLESLSNPKTMGQLQKLTASTLQTAHALVKEIPYEGFLVSSMLCLISAIKTPIPSCNDKILGPHQIVMLINSAKLYQTAFLYLSIYLKNKPRIDADHHIYRLFRNMGFNLTKPTYEAAELLKITSDSINENFPENAKKYLDISDKTINAIIQREYSQHNFFAADDPVTGEVIVIEATKKEGIATITKAFPDPYYLEPTPAKKRFECDDREVLYPNKSEEKPSPSSNTFDFREIKKLIEYLPTIFFHCFGSRVSTKLTHKRRNNKIFGIFKSSDKFTLSIRIQPNDLGINNELDSARALSKAARYLISSMELFFSLNKTLDAPISYSYTVDETDQTSTIYIEGAETLVSASIAVNGGILKILKNYFPILDTGPLMDYEISDVGDHASTLPVVKEKPVAAEPGDKSASKTSKDSFCHDHMAGIDQKDLPLTHAILGPIIDSNFPNRFLTGTDHINLNSCPWESFAWYSFAHFVYQNRDKIPHLFYSELRLVDPILANKIFSKNALTKLFKPDFAADMLIVPYFSAKTFRLISEHSIVSILVNTICNSSHVSDKSSQWIFSHASARRIDIMLNNLEFDYNLLSIFNLGMNDTSGNWGFKITFNSKVLYKRGSVEFMRQVNQLKTTILPKFTDDYCTKSGFKRNELSVSGNYERDQYTISFNFTPHSLYLQAPPKAPGTAGLFGNFSAHGTEAVTIDQSNANLPRKFTTN